MNSSPEAAMNVHNLGVMSLLSVKRAPEHDAPVAS